MTSFRLWIQEKSLIISTPRVASFFLDTVLYKEKIGRNFFSINNNLEIEISKNPTIDDIDFEKNLNSLKTNDIEKDIIIIYRHPKEKIILGLIEDFNEILNNKIYYNNFLIEYFFNFDKSYTDFYFKDADEFNSLIININDEKNIKFKDFYLSLLRLYFEFYINHSFNSAHFSNSMSILYPFIHEKIIKHSHLKFIDIDSVGYNPLFEFINNNNINEESKRLINSNNHIVKLVKEFIIPENNDLSNKINKIIENELFFYNIIKNSKYNNY